MNDTDRLPPSSYLALEVLADRYRLGEESRTLPTSVANALEKLHQAGLIYRMNGIKPRTVRAGLTEKGKAEALSAGYRSPNGGVERPRQALQLIAELAGSKAELVPGMREIAEVAQRRLGVEP